MKKIFVFLFAAMFALSGCQNGLDEISDRLDNLEGRVETLEQLCGDMNANIATIQAFVAAHQNDLYIEKITEAADGFTITFSNGKTYTLKNGDKGNKGDKGDQGATGPQGEQGATPVVSIAYSAEDGYYWTVNGEPVLIDGKKVSALGVTPQLRINEGKWEISYDNGAKWEEVASAYDQSTKITVSEDENAVYLTLADGTVFTISKVPGFAFKVEKYDLAVSAGQTVELAYTLADGDESVRFEVKGTYEAEVVPTDNNGGVIKITVPNPVVKGYVMITAVKNSTSEFKAQYISIEEAVMSVSDEAFTAEQVGGSFKVTIQTNLAYEVKIPAEAQEWISVVESRAIRTDVVTFLLAENTTEATRTATVTIEAEGFTKSVTFVQSNTNSEPIYFTVEPTEPIAVAADATTATVSVKANVPWTVTVPEGVTAEPATGSADAEVVLTFVSNVAAGVYKKSEFEVIVATENTSVATTSYTVKVAQAAAENPNKFTTVRWGNNLGLSAEHADQWRITKADGTLTVPVASSDIPEGAVVAYKISTPTNGSNQPGGLAIDEATGTITITYQGVQKEDDTTYRPQAARAHYAYVTVTVGEGDAKVSKKFPFFVHHAGLSHQNNRANGLDVQLTPFAFRFNPKTGGTITPTVKAYDATGAEVTGLTLDNRRNAMWYNLNSKWTNKSTPASDATDNVMVAIWDSYYAGVNTAVSYSSISPISYWNTAAENLQHCGYYITPETFAVTVNPEKFVLNGVYGDGVVGVGMQANVNGESPMLSTAVQCTPMLIYLDSSLVEE